MDKLSMVWGSNSDGQLGIGNTIDQHSPVPIGMDWLSVACGAHRTLAIREDGKLFAWGRNGYGQLGLGNTTNQTSPVQVGDAKWTTISGGALHSYGQAFNDMG